MRRRRAKCQERLWVKKRVIIGRSIHKLRSFRDDFFLGQEKSGRDTCKQGVVCVPFAQPAGYEDQVPTPSRR